MKSIKIAIAVRFMISVYLYVQSHMSQAQTQLQQNRDQLAQSQKELHQANNNSQQV